MESLMINFSTCFYILVVGALGFPMWFHKDENVRIACGIVGVTFAVAFYLWRKGIL